MTIKIKAYQKNGIKTDKVIDEFEFCCWEKLKEWLDSWDGLNKCPECVKSRKEGMGEKNGK